MITTKAHADTSHRGVKTISLSRFTKQYRPHHGGRTWREAVPQLMSDADFAESVELLRQELRTSGSFRNPVMVRNTLAALPFGLGFLTDGQHRTVASILEGVTTIKILSADSLPDPEGYVWCRATLVVHDDCELPEEEVLDRILGALGSFRLPDFAWTGFASATTRATTWEVSFEGIPQGSVPLLEPTIRGRLLDRCIPLASITVSEIPQDEGEDAALDY